MAPWKKGVPRSFGNLIKHRIARLLGQFTGVALDRIIRGGLLPHKGQMDRFTALYHTLRNRGQPFDTRIHLESSTTDFIRALTLLSKRAYERVIIASGIVRGGMERKARAKKEWRVRNLFLLYGYSRLKEMLFEELRISRYNFIK